MCKPIDIETITKFLNYNPETGLFTWRVKTSYKTSVGGTAGTITQYGYISLNLKSKQMLAHRAAWAVYYGKWPDAEVDHINRIKTDNRITNLRLATRTQNANNGGPKANNKLGVRGVWKKRNKYVAEIWRAGVKTTIGYFGTLEEAKKAYDDAAAERDMLLSHSQRP